MEWGRANNGPLLDNFFDSFSDSHSVTSSCTHDDSDNVLMFKQRRLHDRNHSFTTYQLQDQYHLVYFIFYVLGMITLAPWNFFITADEYWMYKFHNISKNATDFSHGKTYLQKSFTTYFNIASSIPFAFVLMITTIINQNIAFKVRIFGSLITMTVIFTLTVILIQINTDNCNLILIVLQVEIIPIFLDLQTCLILLKSSNFFDFLGQWNFFEMTIMSIFLGNVASAILSGSVFGIVGKFSPTYITAVLSGQALGGVFAAIIEILSITFNTSPITGALVYFIIGDLLLILCILLCWILTRSVFFKYHLTTKIQHGNGSDSFASYSNICQSFIDQKLILRKVAAYGLASMINTVVTFSVYPGATVLIQPMSGDKPSTWNNLYFVPVTCYLLFNIGDFCGRNLAGITQWPSNGKRIILFLSTLRVVFIPLFLMCNVQPKRNSLPVLINSDIGYVIIMALFSFSNGYVTNITTISAPRDVSSEEKETASSLIAVFIGFGLTIACILSFIILEMT